MTKKSFFYIFVIKHHSRLTAHMAPCILVFFISLKINML